MRQWTTQPIVRRVVGFAATAGGAYLLAVVLWPWLGPAYAALFRDVARIAAEPIGHACNGVIEFQPLSPTEGDFDSILRVRRTDTRQSRYVRLSTRLMGFTSTALVISLVAATPLPRMRRLRAMLAALVLVHAFIALRILLKVFQLGSEPPTDIVHFTQWQHKVLDVALALFVGSHEAKFVIPAIIWVLTCFGGGNIRRFLDRNPARDFPGNEPGGRRPDHKGREARTNRPARPRSVTRRTHVAPNRRP